MDSRAKQRLTGAVILVALFVLLVPELLTGPHPSSGAPAGSESDPNLKKFTIDIDDKSKSTSAASSSAAEGAVSLPAVTPTPAPSAPSRAVPGESAVPPNEAMTNTPAANAPASSAAGSVSTGTATNAPAPFASAPAASRAPSAHVDIAKPPAPASARGTFVVQLGSFGSRDNANRLVREMTSKGFKAFVAPITTNGRELYRVRVGPAPTRGDAEALAAQLKKIGQSGSIVPIS